jgi:ornithine decarboxylase
MAQFLLSKSKVHEQYKKLQQLGVTISYSLKTNIEVGKVLEETDCWFSVHTMEELEHVSDTRRVLFLALAWTTTDIACLISKGVNKFCVCNTPDLAVLQEYLTTHTAPITLFLRMKLQENTIYTGKHFVFGMTAKEVNTHINKLQNMTLGIHVHRKTQNISEWLLQEELQEVLEENTLKKIDYLNIGGGLPILYRNSSDKNISYIFENIQKVVAWFPKKVIIEPGRFISGPSVKLQTTIKGMFENTIILDCSVYNTAVDTVLCSPIRLFIDGEQEEGKNYLIKGNTPCSLDIMRYAVKLNNPQVGDNIIFLNAGAYNYTTNFCSLKKIPTKIVS